MIIAQVVFWVELPEQGRLRPNFVKLRTLGHLWILLVLSWCKWLLVYNDVPRGIWGRYRGGSRRGDLVGKVSRSTAVGRARIGPANATAASTLGRQILLFFGNSRPTHTSLPPFLDPLNSFPWFFSIDSSPFEIYDENKFGRRLDRVFRPPHQILDQGKGTAVFLVSWAFL